HADVLLADSDGICSGAVWIPCRTLYDGVGTIGPRRRVHHTAENAEIPQLAGVGCAVRIRGRPQWVSERIDGCDRRISAAGGCDLLCVSGAPTVPISEYAIPGAVGQHNRSHGVPFALDLLIPHYEEKRLILDDRTTDSSGELVPVEPGRLGRRPNAIHHLFVIAPGIRVEFGVSDVPYAAAVKLICAGSCENLDLSVAAAEFGVHRRQ